jgi:hypothetical protein
MELFDVSNSGNKRGRSCMAGLCLLECAAADSLSSVGTNVAWPTGWGEMASWCWYLWGGGVV